MSSDFKPLLKSLPKIDLHRHLEGSVRPTTIAEICERYHIPIPTCDSRKLAAILQLKEPAANLEDFFEPFKIIKTAFVNKEEINRITYEIIEDAALDNIQYLELRFSPEFMAFYHKLDLREVMDGITDAVKLAQRKLTPSVGLIVSISRHLNPETMRMPWPTPSEIVSLALDYTDRGVVGLDLAGKESGFPAELFAQPFIVARNEGLGITVHAGEDSGPESVRSAIEILRASRIGHGVRIVKDPEVMKLAADRNIAFEVCPTSNVLTRAVESIDTHPIKVMYDSGLAVTINTDDPTICGTTLTDEYDLVMEKFGFSIAEIHKILETARRYAFMRY